MNGVQIHTQTAIKLRMSTPIPHQQTTLVKSECNGVNIKSISVYMSLIKHVIL